jgi:predicted nucleotidyltransferase
MALPGADDLARLLSHHALPTLKLKEVAESLEGIAAAAVFGSYASEAARAGSDIDVLVVGDVSRVEAQAAFRGLARELKREINVTTLSPREFRRQSRSRESFVSEVLAKPYLPLKGALDAAQKH